MLSLPSCTPLEIAEKILLLFEKNLWRSTDLQLYPCRWGVKGYTSRILWMRLKSFIDYFEPQIDVYNSLLTANRIFIERTANVAVMDAEMAINYGITGPQPPWSRITMGSAQG